MGRKGPKTKTYDHPQVTLDKFLGSKNLWRKPIAKDGSCLFRAVAEQVLLCQSYHHDVRLQCADYIQRHRDDFKEFLTMKVDTYLTMLRDGQLWGGEVELVVFSKMYRRSIVVYNQQENRVQEQVFFSPEDEAFGVSLPEELCNPIILAYSDGNHYDSVYTKKHRTSMAFCQSVLYSLLYEKVFKEPLSQSSKSRLKSLYESELQKLATEKCDKHLAFLSKTYKMEVLEGMGQNCYSNTALYVYQRERECIEQKDRSVAASIQFQVGDKCLVPVPGQPGAARYKGEIASPLKPNACHMVFIYDVGEQWEIPCKDITLPPPSPVPPPVKQSSGPPKAWSKARIQASASRKQSSGDRSPPPSSSPLSLPLPLPDPIPPTLPLSIAGLVAQQQTVQSNLSDHPTVTNALPPPLGEVPDTNQPPSKASQSQPKGPTVPKSVSAKPTRASQSGASLLGPAPRIPFTKGGGAEVGGASQRPGRKVAEVAATEEQLQRKDELKTTHPKASSRPMGALVPGFPAGKRPKLTTKPQKASEGDRTDSATGQSADPTDLGSSLIKSPTERKFPSPTPPTTAPLLGGGGGPQTAGTFPREQNATYPPVVAKTPAGPRGSLSTSDESASSSDESCNGHHPSNPTQSTANTTAVPMTFFSHLGSMGQSLLPVVPEGRATTQPPSGTQGARVASAVDRPLMHAPVPQSQPPQLTPPPQPHLPVPLPHPAPPGLLQGSPRQQVAQQTSVAGLAQEPGRESPYLESRQLQESSQPEEAWPMVGEELHGRDQLHESLSSSLAQLPSRLAFVPPFGVPPSPSSDPALAMMHPAHLQPPLPTVPFNPSAPLPPHVFPFMLLPPQQRETREPSVESKEVQASPGSCDTETQTEPRPVMRNQKTQVNRKPPSTSRYIQCSPKLDEAGCQTNLQAMGEPLLLLEEIKPPEMTDDSLDAQLRFITDYTLQCLRTVMRHSPEAAAMLSGTVELVEKFEEAFQEKMEEERQQAQKEAITMHKSLNADEQNFLQLFSSAQQVLPDPIQGRVPPREEPGRQGRALPYALHSLPTAGHAPGSAEQEDALSRLSSVPPFTSERTEGGEEEGSLQPHQEASVHPYPHMTPGPMVVPPGARPMVMSVPGMPPMGWYPYMPFPMFIPPHMAPGMMQPAPPHMAPGQGPDSQTFLPEDAQQVPQNAEEQEVEGAQNERQERLVSGRVRSEVMVTKGRSGDGQEGEGHSEEGDGGRVSAEVPMAFPSADVKTEHSMEGVEGARTEGMVAEPPSPQTLDLVTPLMEQNSLPRPPPSPHPPPSSPPPPPSPPVATAPPDEDNTSSASELASQRQPSKDPPLTQQSHVHPGLPCRRRDAADHLVEKEGPEPSQSKGEKEDTSLPPSSPAAQTPAPATHKQRQGRGKSHQMASSYRNRGPKDGSHQANKPQHHTGGVKSGGGQSSRSGRHHQQYHSSQQAVPTQSSQYVSQPSSGNENVSSPQPHPQPPPPQPQPAVSDAGGASTTGGQKTSRAVEADSSGGGKTGNSGTAGGGKPVPTGGGKAGRAGVAETSSSEGGKTSSSGSTRGVKPAQVKTGRTGVIEAGSSGPTEGVTTGDGGSAGRVKNSGSGSVVETGSSGSAGGVKTGSSGSAGGVKTGSGGSAGGVKTGSSGSAGGVKTGSGGSAGGVKTGSSGSTDAVETGSSGRSVEDGEAEQTECVAPSAESKTARHQQVYYRNYRYRDGRKSGGSGGGYRSNPPRAHQQGSRASQTATSHDTTTTSSSSSSSSSSYKQRNLTNGGKLVKGDAAKKSKKYGATPSSAHQSQQEPTRGARENPPVAEITLIHPLPSFKNLYSSSPKDECHDLSNPQNCWPSWTDDGQQLMTLSPISPHSPASGCEQSSVPHFPALAHSPFAQCTYDSTISQQDILNWNKANILHFFPALLDPSPQISPSTNLA